MLPNPSSIPSEDHWRKGIKAGIPIAIGYMPIAFAFGLLAKSTGLTMLETVCMSVFVFAGASQYIALSLIAAGTSASELIITAFIMNIRHLLMSASLQNKTEPDRKWVKGLYAFMVTDETFSVASTREEVKLSSGFMLGLGGTAYASWVLFSGVGYAMGSGLPQTLQDSMGIALYAMFIGLLVPAAKTSKKVIILASAAAILNSIFSFFPLLKGGWGIIVSTIISAVLVEWVYKEGPKRE